jgi:L-lactate dehydrogenase (cytochrome)
MTTADRPGTPRRMPRWSELRSLINPRPLRLDPVARRLSRAYTIHDLRISARRQVPRPIFDYVDGAAESEISLSRAREAYRSVEFRPRILRNVSDVDTSRDILGRSAPLPLVLAPTGMTRMIHHHGEIAVARAAARAGLPYTLSTMGNTSIEDLAAAVPEGRRWFQLYLWRDRVASEDLVKRALANGYDTLMLTVDTPVAGARMRDVRNGFTVPPNLTVRTLADISLHPAWWFNFLTTGSLEFASFKSWNSSLTELVNHMFDPSATVEDLRWLRATWPHSLIVKGIQDPEDAKMVVDEGVDAVVISNHGGRQLDRAATPLRLLPSVLDAVNGRAEVYIDTGITSGSDIAAAVGLGATGVLIGRAYLYGLMAAGEPGVDKALEILNTELRRTLQLLGATTVNDLDHRYVSLPA